MANLYDDLNKDMKILKDTDSIVKGAGIVLRIITETGGILVVGFAAIKIVAAVSTGFLAPLGVGISAGTARIIARQVSQGYMHLDKHERKCVCSFLRKLGFGLKP